jgi:hypothetical protein
MKKIYSLIACIITVNVAFSQFGQLQNGGFENWSPSTVYDFPLTWGSSNQGPQGMIPTVFKSTDAQVGTYSAELRSVAAGPNPDTLGAYVFHGTVGASGPSGGIPYTTVFNTVKFQYKSSMITSSDSVYLYVIRFFGGVPVEFLSIPAIGGTHSTWTQGSVTLTSTPQQQLFIGFTIGDPISGNLVSPGSWARIDNVQMYNGAATVTNVPDPSFESWDAFTVENPDNWNTLNTLLASASLENVLKSTDAHSGNFAAQLNSIANPNNGDTIQGALSLGVIDLNLPNPFIPAPYNASPTGFNGYYKYTGSNGDNGALQLVFMKNGNPVGSVSETFTNQSVYTAFSSPVILLDTPDSIVFLVSSGSNPGSTLLLDDLSFTGGDVGLDEFESMTVPIYPNPAKNEVFIKSLGTFSYQILDMTGKVLLAENNLNQATAVNIEVLDAGSYIVHITSNNTMTVESLVVMK